MNQGMQTQSIAAKTGVGAVEIAVTDADRAVRFYRDYVGLMSHFDTVLPGRIHRLIYEDLVEDTEREVRRLLRVCGPRPNRRASQTSEQAAPLHLCEPHATWLGLRPRRRATSLPSSVWRSPA